MLYCETRTHVVPEDFEHSDDDFVADSSDVVVFSDQATNRKSDRTSKAQMRAFMVLLYTFTISFLIANKSSKVAKITSDVITVTHTEEREGNEDER